MPPSPKPFVTRSSRVGPTPAKLAVAAVVALAPPSSSSAEALLSTPQKRPISSLVTPETVRSVVPRLAAVTSQGSDDDVAKETNTAAGESESNEDATKIFIPKKNSSTAKEVRETSSFQAITALTWPHLEEQDREIPMHTLILGTHPSEESLRRGRYYGHPMNAFWWIAGDCLGFRRSEGRKKSGEPYKFAADLRSEYANNIIPYQEQVACFVRHGFGLWDIAGTCTRPGSLDKNIQSFTPNNIGALAESHPHLRRIVISNGATSAKLFLKGNAEWVQSGALRANDDEISQKILGKDLVATVEESPICVVVAKSPSPAAASISYVEKRTFWETHVYAPGLADHKAFQERAAVSSLDDISS